MQDLNSKHLSSGHRYVRYSDHEFVTQALTISLNKSKNLPDKTPQIIDHLTTGLMPNI